MNGVLCAASRVASMHPQTPPRGTSFARHEPALHSFFPCTPLFSQPPRPLPSFFPAFADLASGLSLSLCAHVHMQMCIYVCMYIYIHTHMYVCTCACACVWAFPYRSFCLCVAVVVFRVLCSLFIIDNPSHRGTGEMAAAISATCLFLLIPASRALPTLFLARILCVLVRGSAHNRHPPTPLLSTELAFATSRSRVCACVSVPPSVCVEGAGVRVLGAPPSHFLCCCFRSLHCSHIYYELLLRCLLILP